MTVALFRMAKVKAVSSALLKHNDGVSRWAVSTTFTAETLCPPARLEFVAFSANVQVPFCAADDMKPAS